MSTEPKPQENGTGPHPYLEELLAMAERVCQREEQEQAGKRGYASTTSAIVSNIHAEIRRLEKFEKDWSPVTMERTTLEQAMGPFASLANILTSAGHHGVDLDAGDVGNVLGALAHYAYKKTNAFPLLGDATRGLTMNAAMLTPLQVKETPEQPIDLEALARHLENIRGRIVLYMCPHGTGGRTDAEQRRHVLQAEAYKTCAASLMAAASAIRTFQAQQNS